MYLLDTNIFLEILLNQEKSSECKEFLLTNENQIFISDFSLHSIGVILFRYNKSEIFRSFIEDIISKIRLLNLPASAYDDISSFSTKLKLDFDNLYQYSVAKYYDLHIVTIDSDFKKIKDLKVHFL
ncbi:MAG: PIN domain-containing protein [Candidatus Marinimicrobia bacterium]|nr:PIN domain-containing protein [bacterium]MCG2714927.1 PIN domain-containing protein [Candidatus Neomarinimicrobiota bacterium]